MIAARPRRARTQSTQAIAEVLGRAARRAESPEPLAAPPTLGLCVLTCMDARIDPAVLLGLAPGEAHVLRTAGALATPEVIEALRISQHDGGTREILVIHHTGCVALGVKEPGRTPDETVAEAVESIRSADPLAYRDRVAGVVLDLSTGLLREPATTAHPGPA